VTRLSKGRGSRQGVLNGLCLALARLGIGSIGQGAIGMGDCWFMIMILLNSAKLIYLKVGLNPFILRVYS